MTAHITPAGAAAMVRAALVDAQAALFDDDTTHARHGGGRQVTKWEPYDLAAVEHGDTPPGVSAPRRLMNPWLEIRTPDGTWIRWAASAVHKGDVVHPPPLEQWLTSEVE